MSAERLLTDIIGWWENNPEGEHIYQKAAQAAHVVLRLHDVDYGCFPTSVAFTHGSAALREARLPLTTQRRNKLRPTAECLARWSNQKLTVRRTTNVSHPKIEKFISTQDALWFVTFDCWLLGHVFAAQKMKGGQFSVFDTNATKLTPPELRYTFDGCSLADLILRAGLHHTSDKMWLEIFGFKNRSST